MALGVPGRLRPRIFSTFGTTRVVGRQPNAPAAFTPGEIPGAHFQRLSRPQDTWFRRKEPRKKSQVTPPGIDPGTVRLVTQRLNHYATPGPNALHDLTLIKNMGVPFVGRGSLVIFLTVVRNKRIAVQRSSSIIFNRIYFFGILVLLLSIDLCWK